MSSFDTTFPKFDVIEMIRANPARFLPGGAVTEERLALRLLSDLLAIPGRLAAGFRLNDWWIVASDADWLNCGAVADIHDHFHRVVPFPEAGVNSMHAEVLLTAYTDHVLTTDGTERLTIKGREDSDVFRMMQAYPDWKRMVAFRRS